MLPNRHFLFCIVRNLCMKLQSGQRLDNELQQRDKVAERYAQLVETQRHFFKAVKDFQDVSILFFCPIFVD